MLKRVVVAAFTALCASLATGALAQTNLPIGTTVSNSSNVLRNTDNPFLFTNVDSLGWLGFTAAPPAFSGQIASWVFSGDTHNPFGGLTFLYQFENCPCGDIPDLPASTDEVHRWVLTGFDHVKTAVAYTSQFAFTDMTDVDRSATGDNIGVDFPTVAPGRVGQLLVYTDATSYGTNQTFLVDGGIVFSSILSPVPEPETYAMFLAGIGFLGFIARRRRALRGALAA